MIKKVILGLFLVCNLFLSNNIVYTDDTKKLNSTKFEIDTGMLPGLSTQETSDWKKLSNTSEVINYTLWTIIQKLMVALWVLAVLIMTVWAGYIIMYHGQDELLSKGKSIFMAGVTALIVALSSYYLVSILRFVLYN